MKFTFSLLIAVISVFFSKNCKAQNSDVNFDKNQMYCESYSYLINSPIYRGENLVIRPYCSHIVKSVWVINLAGKTVAFRGDNRCSGDFEMPLNLNPGLYLIRITFDDNESKSDKIFVR